MVHSLVMVFQLQSKTATLNLCVVSLHFFYVFEKHNGDATP